MENSVDNVLELCCICFQQNGDANIHNSIVDITTNFNLCDFGVVDSRPLTILELLHIFMNNELDFLQLIHESSQICLKCLNELKACYVFYKKLKVACIQLKQLFQESSNNVTNDDIIIEMDEEQAAKHFSMSQFEELIKKKTSEYNSSPITKDVIVSNDDDSEENICVGTEIENNAFLCNNIYLSDEESKKNGNDDFSSMESVALQGDHVQISKPKLMTIECRPSQLNDVNQFPTLDVIHKDESETKNNDIIYICQYCPQAFTRLIFLKEHLQKTHICKFCASGFKLSVDLFKHIREMHSDYECTICNKILKTHGNLKRHSERIHGITLTNEIVNLDFIEKPLINNDDEVEDPLTSPPLK